MTSNKMMIITILCILGLASNAVGSSLDKAKMLRQHGLISEAKKELIEVIFGKQNAKDKAEAYYTLGTMAFEENDISVALETWTQLTTEFPKSDKAKLVKDRINQLSERAGEASRTVVANAIAQSYLRNADFWSAGKSNAFEIDGSYISRVEAAISWYDRVIREFPHTEASRLAYEGKMRTLIGWEDAGPYGDTYGMKKDFLKYLSQLLEAFAAFEQDHPNAPSLQAFRYQIADEYWKRPGSRLKAKKWYNLVIEKSGEHHTFYRDLAERRLRHFQ